MLNATLTENDMPENIRKAFGNEPGPKLVKLPPQFRLFKLTQYSLMNPGDASKPFNINQTLSHWWSPVLPYRGDRLGALGRYKEAQANDVTMRDFQYHTHQWLQGKAWQASTPLGPYLVTPDEVGEMAGAVLVFKEHMVRAGHLAAEREQERKEAETAKQAALLAMAETIESEAKQALAEIGRRTGAMAEAANGMSASAARTGASAESAASSESSLALGSA